jgi:hypothetical protein
MMMIFIITIINVINQSGLDRMLTLSNFIRSEISSQLFTVSSIHLVRNFLIVSEVCFFEFFRRVKFSSLYISNFRPI